MDCAICHRPSSEAPPLNCTTCARTALYPSRIALATGLLEREKSAHMVEAIASGDFSQVAETTTLDGAIVHIADCARAHALEETQAQIEKIDERIREMRRNAEALRRQLEEYRGKMAAKKQVIEQRRNDAEAATFNIQERSAAELDALQKTIRVVRRKWDVDHKSIVLGRISLCREAAKLAGLHISRQIEGQAIRDRYMIATGLRIVDLRKMNAQSPEELTASLAQVAYLVSRVSTYLALRLPAEIVLQQKESPYTSIFSPAASHQGREQNSSSSSKVSSPSASRIMEQRGSRPRPLYTTRTLPKLYKEDPSGFSLFVEGVVLLAWNIGWLCRTQGMGGFSSWSDLCNMGRNLCQLLLSDRGLARTIPERKASTRSAVTSPTAEIPQDGAPSATSKPASAQPPPPAAPTHFGRFSHGTAHSFFGTKDGTDTTRGYQTPTRAIDKLKAYLIAEMQGAEWEVVDEREWADATDAVKRDEEPALVKGRRFSAVKKSEERRGSAAASTPAQARLRGKADSGRSTPSGSGLQSSGGADR